MVGGVACLMDAIEERSKARRVLKSLKEEEETCGGAQCYSIYCSEKIAHLPSRATMRLQLSTLHDATAVPPLLH
jgi:hypothetical protein